MTYLDHSDEWRRRTDSRRREMSRLVKPSISVRTARLACFVLGHEWLEPDCFDGHMRRHCARCDAVVRYGYEEDPPR